MRTWIAEESVVFVLEDGPRMAGTIAIGLPVVREHDCACDVMIGTLDVCTVYGDTTLQALLLAIRFAGTRLQHFLSKGGRIVFPDDGLTSADIDVPLHELFGFLVARPGDAGPTSDVSDA